MSKSEKRFTLEEMEREIRAAYIHGQGNGILHDAGLERDETEDYLSSRMKDFANLYRLEQHD